jgi:hypothetical protein
MKYRKKPVVIEAVQWFKDGDHPKVFADAKGHTGLRVADSWQSYMKELGYPHGVDYVIDTLEGRMLVSSGDWIIKGVKGEFYPCKPDIFLMTYDRVEEGEGL